MSKIYKKLQIVAKEHPILPVLGVFLLAFCYFFYLQYTPAFPDPDSFYHAKIAELFAEGKFIKDFPWLADYTILGENYTDQHFLYHIFLIPFVKIFGGIIGIKVATIFLAAVLFALFYWFLKKWKIRFKFLYLLVLAFSNPFIFRISLAKAPSLSIIFLLLALHLMFEKKHQLLFLLSFLYVWSYGGFPVLIVFAAIYIFVSLSQAFFKNRHQRLLKVFRRLHPVSFRERVKKNQSLRLALSVIMGVVLGLVINPYFPKNLRFLWYQFFKIGVVNYQSIIGVGGEWYPYDIFQLIPNTVFLTMLILTALVILVIKIKKLPKAVWVLFLITVFFLVLTLKSRRYVEYYIPFGTLFAALAINQLAVEFSVKRFWQKLGQFYSPSPNTSQLAARMKARRNLRSLGGGGFGWLRRIPLDTSKLRFEELHFKQKIAVTVLIVYLLVTIPTIVLKDIKSNRNDFKYGIPYTKYENSATWLKQNTPAGSLVLHSDWDDFPVLFYHNDHNRYIVGLDPTFMYANSQDLYWKWVRITTGQEDKAKVYDIIKNDFQNANVFVEKDHQEMNRLFQDNEKFYLIFEDQEVEIYAVKE